MIIFTYSVIKTQYSVHGVSVSEYGDQRTIELKTCVYASSMHVVVVRACRDIQSGISLPRYCRAGDNGKISICCCCFSPALCCSTIRVVCLVFVALPCTSSGLPLFANIMHSSINNTLLLTTICDLNRVFNVITNKYQWCYVLIFTYRLFSVFLDILIMRCDGW